MPDDVLIVGGGPAGIATALFLAHSAPERTGDIVVLEKERYPRDKFCAGGLGARGEVLLQSIGLTVDVPSVAIEGVSLRVRTGEVVVRSPGMGRVVRRLEFDAALASAAKQRGIRIVEGARAVRVRAGPDDVEVESTAGTFRGAVVVGADGVGSVVRRALGLPAGTYRAQVIELDTESVDGDKPRDLLHFDASDPSFTGYAWDFPTVVDGKPLVCRGIFHLRLGPSSVDVQSRLAARLAARRMDITQYRAKRFAERGFEFHQPFAQRRALLVGEAAGIDPLTGEGIPQALQYGAWAGQYLAEKLPRGAFDFEDFVPRLRRTKLGVDLSVRTAITRHYFGPHRGRFDRFLLDTPEFVSSVLELFAGRRVSRLHLGRSLLSAAWHWASLRR